ncbi:hypothetical protein [Kribbella sp. VKM Ac-2566]|uniref:ApyA family aminopyruvatide-related RiPP n=1 Tax=Kribbella sp. VKM Ac-2566 TaxID=2512218 RepID=UPI00106258D8|nr:hypothetical protein [Kribbella sp. VKM Ac-2566]TDW91131.1 hypothetical protein EV647_4702 [Kribbella sp. VKM Ac-2566]
MANNDPSQEPRRPVDLRGPHVAVTPDAVVFALGEEQREAAKQCMEKNGRVTFTFREISVTDLLELKALDGPDGGVIVD